MPRPVHRRDSGYALLFVFLMIAIIGIAMYAAMPRVAFEAQRDQEQLLIDRGEQYKRALQLYFRKFKKYPGKVEDLEDTNGQRFLRQRYADPMTGKSEWRLIHVGGAGQLTDSLTQKNDKKKTDPASVNNFITELQGVNDASAPAAVQTGVGMRRRPSDQPGGADASLPQGGATYDPSNPNSVAGLPPSVIAGGPDPMSNSINSTAGQNGNPAGVNPNGASAQNSSSAAMIQNLLTSPRPGGAPSGIFDNNGSQTGTTTDSSSPFSNNTNNSAGTNIQSVNGRGMGQSLGNSAAGGLTVGGGIAGFASKDERQGIKIYKDYQKYKQWEFIYDPNKDTSMGVNQAQQNMLNAQKNTAVGAANAAVQTPDTTNVAQPVTAVPGQNPTPRLPFQQTSPPTPVMPQPVPTQVAPPVAPPEAPEPTPVPDNPIPDPANGDPAPVPAPADDPATPPQ